MIERFCQKCGATALVESRFIRLGACKACGSHDTVHRQPTRKEPMIVTPNRPNKQFSAISNGAQRCAAYRETLKVWDALKEAGYRPHALGLRTIIMQQAQFLKFVIDHGGMASVVVRNGFRLSSVWISYVEITCTEEISGQLDEVVADRQPLPDYFGDQHTT